MAHTRKRHIAHILGEALSFSPLVGIMGHRQVGKTTLLESVEKQYYTLDRQLDFDLRLIFPTTLDFRILLRLLEILSLSQGRPFSYQEISSLSGISVPTLEKLLSAFENLFLIRDLPIDGKSCSLLFFETLQLSSKVKC